MSSAIEITDDEADGIETVGDALQLIQAEGETMKPQTISTLEGMFTLDRDGFYIPYEEPEPKISGAWMYVLAAVVASLVVGAVWMAARAVAG
jgi:hypothetical protein